MSCPFPSLIKTDLELTLREKNWKQITNLVLTFQIYCCCSLIPGAEIRMNISAPPKSYLSVLNQHYIFMLQTRLKRGNVCSKYGCQGFLHRPITWLRSIKKRLLRG